MLRDDYYWKSALCWKTATAALSLAAVIIATPAKADKAANLAFHQMVQNNEVQALAQYGPGKPPLKLTLTILKVATDTDAEGNRIAYSMSALTHVPTDPYFGAGIATGIPTATEIYCLLPMDAAAALERNKLAEVTGTVVNIEEHERWSNAMGRALPYKRVFLQPCMASMAASSSGGAPPADNAGGNAPPAAGQSLCTPRETVAFSCRTGKKLVSVCLSSDFANGTGALQYRFGPLGAPEKRLPDVATSRQGVTAGTIAYSGGGADYIRFAHGDTRYVVYSGEGRGWVKEGVAVEQKGKLLANLPCKENSTGTLTPHGGGTLSVPGLPEDTEGFEIPE